MLDSKFLAPVARELKLVNEELGVIAGYGSVFNVTDSQGDIVVPGAFAKSLAEWQSKSQSPAMLWMHDPSQPVGVWDDIAEDAKGLVMKGRLSISTQKGKDAYELLKMGALSGLSIGYQVVDREWKGDTRILKSVNLFEVSLVTFPACDAARVNGVKGIERFKTIREFEDFLRDEGGLSSAQAKAVASRGFKANPGHRDDDGAVDQLLASIKRASSLFNPVT